MTDTAQPLPDEQTSDPKTADGELTHEMKQRAAALDIARQTLISRSGLFGGQNVGQNFDVQDLLNVADYVLDVGPRRDHRERYRQLADQYALGMLPVDSPENKTEDQPVPDASAGWNVADGGPHYEPKPEEPLATGGLIGNVRIVQADLDYPEDALPR